MFKYVYVYCYRISHTPHTSHPLPVPQPGTAQSTCRECSNGSQENWRPASDLRCLSAAHPPPRESARSELDAARRAPHRRRHRGRCESLRSCAAAASRYTAFSCRARPARLPEGGLTRRTTVKTMQTRSAAASAIQVGCIAATRASARALVSRIAATPTRRGGSA